MLNEDLPDPSVDDNLAIREACRRGDLVLVKNLLQDSRVDPAANDNEVFRSAVAGGFVELVKLLLNDPRIDPTANDNEAFFFTIHDNSENQSQITTLLFNDKRIVDSGTDKLPSFHNDHSITWSRQRTSDTARTLVSQEFSKAREKVQMNKHLLL